MSLLTRFYSLLFCLLCLLCLTALPAHAEDPLEPEQAFRFSAAVIDAHTIEVRWDIAPGYYMYRDKFSFSVAPGSLGKVEFPAGQVKEDENFGRVETYRDLVRLALPLSNATGQITLSATSQGCADIGICYPPQKHVAVLDLPASTGIGSAPAATPSPLSSTPLWQQRLLRPSVLFPALLGLVGVALAAVPLRVRRGLWFKGAGFILMFVSAIFLLLLNDEEAPSDAPSAQQVVKQFASIKNVTELDALLALSDKPVLLDFYADWCGPCQEMEKHTFADATVQQRLMDFTLLRADVTANTDEHKALLKRFGLQGPPGIIVFDAKGNERKDLRIIGYRAPEAFLSILNTTI